MNQSFNIGIQDQAITFIQSLNENSKISFDSEIMAIYLDINQHPLHAKLVRLEEAEYYIAIQNNQSYHSKNPIITFYQKYLHSEKNLSNSTSMPAKIPEGFTLLKKFEDISIYQRQINTP